MRTASRLRSTRRGISSKTDKGIPDYRFDWSQAQHSGARRSEIRKGVCLNRRLHAIPAPSRQREHATRADREPRERGRPRARSATGRLGRSRAARDTRNASPVERVAFVLHDLFHLPIGEIAPIVGRSADRGKAVREPRTPPVQGAATVPKDSLHRAS